MDLEGTTKLLGVLQHMQQLTSLELRGCMCFEECPVASSLAALTASSGLQSLSLDWWVLKDPADRLAAVFPPHRQLLQLTSLDLEDVNRGLDKETALRVVKDSCPALKYLGLRSRLSG